MAIAATSLYPMVSVSQSRPSPPSSSSRSSSASPVTAAATTLTRGEKRPDFKLKDLEGNDRHLSEWDGKLIFLNFWATWCPPCLHEIPMFNRMQDQYSGAGVQFLGVALDHAQDVRRFIAKHGMRYPTLHGAQDAIALSQRYGNQHGTLPYTVVIGRDGKVLHTHAGPMQAAQVQALIRHASPTSNARHTSNSR